MSLLFDKLTTNELQMIDYSISEYAYGHGQRASLEYVLRFWDESKQEFLYDLLGKKLSVTKEIEIDRQKQVESDFSEALTKRDNPIYQFKLDILQKIHPNDDSETLLKIYNCFTPEALTNNSYNGSKFTMSLGDKTVRFEKGMKVIKILSKIADFYDMKDEFEEFRQYHSTITNTKTLKGKLTLSIHPLDYITMSDNMNGWSSCMSWAEDGCYRQGTVEMMNSNCVLVAFLESSDSEMRIGYGNNYWNSKKWRTLVICTKDVIAPIKAYPYQSDDLTIKTIDFIKELAKENLKLDFDKNIEYNYDYYNVLESYGIESFGLKFFTENMYNDFGCVDYHFISFANNFIQKIKSNELHRLSIKYSGTTQCMWCGESCEVDDTVNLVCPECSNYITCDYCGSSTSYDELSEVDGMMICEYCRENETFIDPIDGDIHLLDNSVRVYIVNNPEILDNRSNTSVPYFRAYNDNAYGTIDENRYFNKNCEIKTYRGRHNYITLYYVNFKDIKEESMENMVCNLWGHDSLSDWIESNNETFMSNLTKEDDDNDD